MVVKLAMAAGMIGHLLGCLYRYLNSHSLLGKVDAHGTENEEELLDVLTLIPSEYTYGAVMVQFLSSVLLAIGYFGLCGWMSHYSGIAFVLMSVCAPLYLVSSLLINLFKEIMVWFSSDFKENKDLYESFKELHSSDGFAVLGLAAGYLVFFISMFIAVVSGSTNLPRWACLFNALLLRIPFILFRKLSSGDITGTIMFLGLLFLI